MSIPLSRLFDEEANPYELTLLAGENGLSHEVSWIQVMEDSDYASFLLENELLFTTGLGRKQQDNWLSQFIQALIEAGSSGVVINVGKYILQDDITQDILDLCNDKSFPLFIMPWKIRLADVTQAFLSALFLTQQTDYELVEACQSLFYTTGHEEKSIQTLAAHGFSPEGPYQVAAISDTAISDGRLTTYKGCLNALGFPYILFAMKSGYILVYPVTSAGNIACIYEALQRVPAFRDNAMGCGMPVDRLEDLRRCYTQALQALAWAKSQGLHMAQFEALGIYSLLFSQTNEQVMQQLHDRLLGSLLHYDEKQKRNLYATLQSYLRHDGGIRAVAEETFAHRNTVLYRMQKIKNLIHNDLQDSESRFNFMLACHIHNYFILKEEWTAYLP